jgi:anti-sigma B factor antagonist
VNSGGNATDPAAVGSDVARDAGDIMVLSLDGDLNAASTPQFRRYALQLMVFESPRVILDVRGLQSIDATGVLALVELCKWARGHGGNLFLRELHGEPLAALRRVQLDRLLVGPSSLQTFNSLV